MPELDNIDGSEKSAAEEIKKAEVEAGSQPNASDKKVINHYSQLGTEEKEIFKTAVEAVYKVTFSKYLDAYKKPIPNLNDKDTTLEAVIAQLKEINEETNSLIKNPAKLALKSQELRQGVSDKLNPYGENIRNDMIEAESKQKAHIQECENVLAKHNQSALNLNSLDENQKNIHFWEGLRKKYLKVGEGIKDNLSKIEDVKLNLLNRRVGYFLQDVSTDEYAAFANFVAFKNALSEMILRYFFSEDNQYIKDQANRLKALNIQNDRDLAEAIQHIDELSKYINKPVNTKVQGQGEDDQAEIEIKTADKHAPAPAPGAKPEAGSKESIVMKPMNRKGKEPALDDAEVKKEIEASDSEFDVDFLYDSETDEHSATTSEGEFSEGPKIEVVEDESSSSSGHRKGATASSFTVENVSASQQTASMSGASSSAAPSSVDSKRMSIEKTVKTEDQLLAEAGKFYVHVKQVPASGSIVDDKAEDKNNFRP